jgi:hypothetical protein
LWLTGSENISQHISANFSSFISSVNTDTTIVISHPGFTDQLSPIKDYLDQALVNYEIIYLTSSILNDPAIAQLINSATNFVFAGDSLIVLSLLKDISTLAGEAFREKTVIFRAPVFFFGKSGKIAGKFYTDNLYSDIYAGYRGRMTNNIGLDLFGEMLFEPTLFDDSDYYENRMSSVLWGMMRNRKRFGVYLDGNTMSVFDSNEKIVRSYGSMPPIYIDASQTSWVDSSTFVASGGVGPRQVVAMNNLRFNITTYDNYGYSIQLGKFEDGLSVDDNTKSKPNDFELFQNYPNPFNPTTSIRFRIKSTSGGGLVSLRIFDCLGREIAELVNREMNPGLYEIGFDGNNLSSGIYLCKLASGDFIDVKKMILIK